MPGAMHCKPSGCSRRGEQLRDALIGETVHADAAVRFGPRAQPRDRLRAVARLHGETDKTRLRNRRARARPESPRCSRAARTIPDARRRPSKRYRGRRAGASAAWAAVPRAGHSAADNNDRKPVRRRRTCGSARRVRGARHCRNRPTATVARSPRGSGTGSGPWRQARRRDARRLRRASARRFRRWPGADRPSRRSARCRA